jgi:methyl-accepting chemotaxis protein
MNAFRNMKLSKKLLLSFLLIAAMALVVGWVGLNSTRKVAAASDEMYSNAFVSVRELAATRGSFLDARIRSRSAVTLPTAEDRRQEYEAFRKDFESVDEHLAKYLNTPLSDQEKTTVVQLRANLATYRRIVEPAFPLAVQMRDREAENLLNQGRSVCGELMAELDQLLEINVGSRRPVRSPTSNSRLRLRPRL